LKSDGMPWRPIVHIRDMSLAFLAVLNAPRELAHNQAFNVGRTKENYRIREMAEIVAEVVPNSYVEFATDAGPDKRNYRVNCDKIANTLSEFKPQWTAKRGAQELYQAFKEASLQPEIFEGPRYRRVHHIKYLLDSGRLDATLRWKV
jgi:nucleoside-diphosphate-sugar epimerase